MYCTYCGTKFLRLEMYPKRYDYKTGEILYATQECINALCSEGKKNYCKRTGGHQVKFWSGRCKKCEEFIGSERVG